MLEYETSFQSHIDSLDFGETTRINHTNCEAGEDTRRRLYITKPASGGGEVLAYCHNCQQGNRWKGGESYRINIDKEFAPSVRSKPLTIADYEAFSSSQWPGDAKSVLYMYGISGETAIYSDIRYDPSTHRLVFPVYDKIEYGEDHSSVGNLKGVQKKRLIGKGTKYITEMNDGEFDLSCILKHQGVAGNYYIGVIVEDYLSGARIIQWAIEAKINVKVLVNYGTKVNPEAIKNMTELTKLIIWLDNDNEHVVAQAFTIGTVSTLIQPKNVDVTISIDYDDPKKQSYELIREVLCG